jgi:hypothetical protein
MPYCGVQSFAMDENKMPNFTFITKPSLNSITTMRQKIHTSLKR